MPVKRWTGSAWQSAKSIRRWTGSAWQPAKTLRRWTGSAWQIVYAGLTATLSTNSLSVKLSSSSGSSAPVSCSVGGGVGPFSYLWEPVVFNGMIQISSTTTASVYFHTSGFPPGEEAEAFYRCRVTDNGTGTVAYSGNVRVSFNRPI